jgi:protein SCO1/2
MAPLAGTGYAQNTPALVIEQVRFDQKLEARVPLDLVFRDEAGRGVRLGDYFGRKPVVLSLVYYDCPMLCTLILNGLVKSLRTVNLDVGTDFEVVTLSFDPREGPALAAEKKAGYVRQYTRAGGEAGWHFLTGDEPAIRQLTEAVGFHYTFDTQTGQFAHASGIVVLTPEGKISKYLYGIEYAPRDLRLSLVEASAGRIGTLSDKVLLYCFHYDPTTGKYGLAIMRITRVAGLLTVALIVGFVAVMLRRERRSTLRAQTERS